VIYHYQIDPDMGWMHARIQTWFPFYVHLCINGREWLARSMDRQGLQYFRQDNCFPWIQDISRAQQLMDQQLESKLDRTPTAFRPAPQSAACADLPEI